MKSTATRAALFIIAATNYPEALDKALFRRFDDIVQFPVPDKEKIYQLYKKELSEFNQSKKFDLKRIAEEPIGLSYADVHRICEDVIKDYLVYGSSEVSEERLISYAHQRKNPF